MNHAGSDTFSLTWQIEKKKRLTFFNLIFLLLIVWPLFGSLVQDKIKIKGQRELQTTAGQPITIKLTDLEVEGDGAENYPNGFTLIVYPGKDYTYSGATVTPAPGFIGNLKVEVSVRNAEGESKIEKINVDVVGRAQENEPPVITGQASPIVTEEDQSIAIGLGNLSVTDPDNTYPEGFSLTILPGDNYTVSGQSIIPASGFSGVLTVPVVVSDGVATSNEFNLSVTVNAKQAENIKPVITGQTVLTVEEGTAITIEFANLQVTDPDNTYPADFTMTLTPGTNYTVSGRTITPALGFTGTLSVPVVVSDGEGSSDPFNLSITVTARPVENIAPVITGQSTLTTEADQPITVEFTNLTVTDPDNPYPTGFSMTLSPGTNYTVSGRTITPAAGYSGSLSVPVVVNDGASASNSFNLAVTVTAKPVENVKPVITGQTLLTIQEGTPITLELSHLTVTDPDNPYPTGFTLTVSTGSNYTVSGRTVTPNAGFIGNLVIPVTVSDGSKSSDPFNVTVAVTAKPVENVAPVITGQNPITTEEGTPVVIGLNDLIVTDSDNPYPAGFSLTVSPGTNYTVVGNTITPAVGFSGNLRVPVVVSDGNKSSASFNVVVVVAPKPIQNLKPVIVGQVPLRLLNTQSLAIALSHLIVTDPDNTYPNDFTLSVLAGPNYTVSGKTIKPNAGFTGILIVKVTVSDGKQNSDPFDLQITVQPPAQNVRPVITGQQQLTTFRNSPLVINLGNLIVTDPDNPYPQGFTLTVGQGQNYVASGATITPAAEFTGSLTVPVTVNDGTSTSDLFNVVVNVIEKNVLSIVGQKQVIINEDESFTVALSDLVVNDPANLYPTGFTMTVLDGENYTAENGTIIPALNYFGNLTVPVQVNNGTSSNTYSFVVIINPVNDAPVFTTFDSTSVLSYSPGDLPLPIGREIAIEDVDNEQLAYAEVQVNPEDFDFGTDQLTADNSSNIRAVFDPNAGTLVLLGLATVGEYQDVLKTVQYSSSDSVVRMDEKRISFRINDGQLFSETKTKVVQFSESIVLDIPTVFTPNDDMANDVWNVTASNGSDQGNMQIRVFDKRGMLVFEATSLDYPWDGTFHGEKLPPDTYFFTIEVNSGISKISRKGVVTLLR